MIMKGLLIFAMENGDEDVVQIFQMINDYGLDTMTGEVSTIQEIGHKWGWKCL